MNILGLIWIPDLIVYIILFFTLFYIYFTWNYDYWNRMGVKTYFAFPSFLTFLEFFFTNMHVVDMKCYKKFGRMWGAFEGRTPTLLVADLDIVKAITIKDFANHFMDRRKFLLAGKSRITRYFLTNTEGEEWKAHRSILSPTFTSLKLKQMSNLMAECSKELVEGISEKLETEKDDMELKKKFAGYAMNVISSCCFGNKINSKDPNDPFIVYANKLFSQNLNIKFFIAIIFPKLIKYFDVSIFPTDVLNFFEKVVNKVVSVRKQQKDKPRDFLQLLLDAQMEESTGKLAVPQEVDVVEETDHYNIGSDLKLGITDSATRKKVLTEEAVVSHSLLFLLAGFDTTATTMSFATYFMALNPDCQEKLVAEIDEVIEKYGQLTYDAVISMEYLDKVLSETLRIMPPAVRIERRCIKDYKLGDVLIKKDMMVGIPVYCIHHDEEYYPNPEKFDPERFTPEVKSQRDPMCYLPFGAGPRNCIGMRFALLEAKMALAHFFREFKASPSNLTDIPVKLKPTGGLLVPINGVHLKIEKRHYSD